MGRMKEIYIEATELSIDPVEYLSMFKDIDHKRKVQFFNYREVDDYETIQTEAISNKELQERINQRESMEK